MSGLSHKSVSAVLWGGGGSVVRIVLQLAVQVVLARLLGPEQYGLFAIGAIVIAFSNFFSDIGLAYGLIQKEEISEMDVRFVNTWQLVLGFAVSTAVYFGSDAIAAFFGDLHAEGVIAGLAVVCFINAITAPSMNMLKRRLDFRRLQIAQILGYVAGYACVGVPMAWSRPEATALVAAWVVQAAVIFVILYTGVRHSVRPLLWFPGARSMVNYGATVFVTNIINWVIGNIDRVIVGRVFASAPLGLYSTSYNTLFGPVSSVLGVVQPVFFSAASRVATHREKIVRVYQGLMAAAGITLLPVFGTLAVVSGTFIHAVYGDRWLRAVPVFAPISLAMPFFLFWGFSTPLLWLAGAPAREFKVQLPMAVIWTVVASAAALVSLQAVAWGVLVFFVIRYLAVFGAARGLVSMRFADIWHAQKAAVLVACTCAVAAWACDVSLATLGLHPLPRLGAVIGVSAVAYVVALRMFRKHMCPELRELVALLAERIPAMVRRPLLLVLG